MEIVKQIKEELAGIEILFNEPLKQYTYTTVSYTHLDVYKRQVSQLFVVVNLFKLLVSKVLPIKIWQKWWLGAQFLS